jgi:CubicO group peptidase (beta-lactamase class C family)
MRSSLLVAGLFASVCSFAQSHNSSLDSLFAAKPHEFFNGQVVVRQNGAVTYHKIAGYADRGNRLPNRSGSLFNLASVTKPFTSTAVLQLVEKGKVELGQPVQTYLKDFPYPEITVRHLLSHTSGLPDLELYEEIVQSYPDSIITNATTLPALQIWKGQLPFRAGNQWRYCNTNYVLLALIIEEVSGLTYPAYLSKHIFQRSGMKNSFVHTAGGNGNSVVKHAYRFWYDTTMISVDSIPRFKYTHVNCSGTVGDQNVVTTLADLLLFDKALFSGKLLQKKTMELAFTPVQLNDGSTFYEASMDMLDGKGKGSYGLGWSIYEQEGIGKGVGHSGFNRGLLTFYYHNLEKNYAIASYDNTASPYFRELMTYLHETVAGNKAKAPVYQKSLARHYGKILLTGGMQPASVFFNLNRTNPDFYVSERELNWLGYELMFGGYHEPALEVFKVNTLLYPKSFNVYDSYAEALARNGYKKEAILMYEKSLAINPDNSGGQKALAKLREEAR